MRFPHRSRRGAIVAYCFTQALRSTRIMEKDIVYIVSVLRFVTPRNRKRLPGDVTLANYGLGYASRSNNPRPGKNKADLSGLDVHVTFELPHDMRKGTKVSAR